MGYEAIDQIVERNAARHPIWSDSKSMLIWPHNVHLEALIVPIWKSVPSLSRAGLYVGESVI